MGIKNNKSEKRSIGALLSVGNMLVSLILAFLYTPFMLKSMGQSEYGVYTLANSIIAYLSILDFGFGATLVRYSARKRAQGKSDSDINGLFFIIYIAIGLIALILGLLLGHNIVFFRGSYTDYEVDILKRVYYILLINTVVSFPLSVFNSILQAHEEFVFINSLALIRTVIQNIVNCLFLYLGYKSIALASIVMILNVIVGLVQLYYSIFILNIKITFTIFEKDFYREVALFSFYIFINIVVDRLYANTDKIILGKVCNSATVAVYGVGVTFESYYAQFSTSISGVFLPRITEISVKADSIKKMSDEFLKVGHIQFVLLLSIAIGFFVFGKDFVNYWAGKEYKDSYYITLIIMIPALIPLSQNIGISILRALNKHAIRSIMYLLIAILNVIVSIPLAMYFKGIGAALGTAFGNLLGQIIFMNWYYWKRVGIDIPQYWKQSFVVILKMIPILIFFCIIDRIVLFDSLNGLILKIIISIVIALVYEYIAVMNTTEKELIRMLISRINR